MRRLAPCLPLLLCGCFSEAPEGLAKAELAATTVIYDWEALPLPVIPLPNDIATRHDPDSATGRRINASIIAPTGLERRVRELFDQLDGWGVNMPISVPFSGPLDIDSILAAHRDPRYDFADDVVYLIDVDRDSPEFGEARALDVGEGNYPVVLEDFDGYYKNDPRGFTNSIFFDEADEDADGDGVLDPGEDTNGNGRLDEGEDANDNGFLDPPEDSDADGILDVPNYLPGATPARDDLGARADALMTFYERETNTLIVRAMEPLRERTTYAVVITRRLKDADGRPVGSPFGSIHHTAQTEALSPLPDVLPEGLALEDVAFAFTFTTQSLQSHWVAVRDGLYGHGVQGHFATDYPAELKRIDRVRDLENPRFAGAKNAHILFSENWVPAFQLIGGQLLGFDNDTEETRLLFESQQYIDYHVVGAFDSPQLFERNDPEGNPLGYNDQSWPPDLDRVPIVPRRETVYFWLTVPREEVSSLGDGEPAPVVVLGHGYGSQRFEMAQFAGFFARHGLATIAIDCVSHGLGIDDGTRDVALRLTEPLGIAPFAAALLNDRAFDQNNDGIKDSGADFWTSYLFHTRDVVRQCGLDYTQLIRIIQSFDGDRRWAFDVDGDGTNELAGDFDADGVVDIGAASILGMTGGSLGGIMSAFVGSLEPAIDLIVPISGGGGLGDIGNRSKQGGVREAVHLRVMGPLYVGTLDETGALALETIVPDLNDDATRPLGTYAGVKPGDTMVVENLVNGERGCGYISVDGTVRAGVASDLDDLTEVRFYAGPKLVTGSTECEVMAGAEPSLVVDRFGADFEFQGRSVPAGTRLRALAEGLGIERATPGMRRFLGIAQAVLDGGDPATYARHLLTEPLKYATGEETGTHALVVTTTGDMNVPASSGLTIVRAAGIVDYRADHPRFDRPANQVLLDTYMAESVHTNGRYFDLDGNPVHVDVDNMSGGTDFWGDRVPRCGLPDIPGCPDGPLRIGFDETDAQGGISAAFFPYTEPTGQHGFDFPGRMIDRFRRRCAEACPEGDVCDCEGAATFDIGNFLFNLLGRYMASGGTEASFDACHWKNDCGYAKPPPAPRTNPDQP